MDGAPRGIDVAVTDQIMQKLGIPYEISIWSFQFIFPHKYNQSVRFNVSVP